MNAKELILKKINADTNWVDIYTSGVILGEDINAIGSFMTSSIINDLVSKYNTSAFDTEYVGTKIDFIKKAIASETDSNKIAAYNELLRRVYIAEELRIMGKILKINQGMPTNSLDLQQYISSIEQYIESRINHVNLENYQNAILQFNELKKRLGLSEELTDDDLNISEVAKALKQIKKAKEQMTSNWIYFDLVKFVQDPEYAEQMDNVYESVKITFNILNTLRQSPHFNEMFKVLGLNNIILTSLSKRNLIERTVWNTAAHKSSKGKAVIQTKLNSTERITLKNLIDDTLADTWIKSNIRNSDDSPVRIIWTVDGKPNVITFDGGFDYKLFIKYIETELIPRLRNNLLVVNGQTIKTANNAFIKHLTFGKDRDGNTIFRLPYNMTQIDKNPGIQVEYEKILNAFGQLRGIILDNGLSVVDMFYLYNLIVHKDKFSRSALTRLFEDLIASDGGEQLLVFKFNEWLETVNENEIVNTVLANWGAIHSNQSSPDELKNLNSTSPVQFDDSIDISEEPVAEEPVTIGFDNTSDRVSEESNESSYIEPIRRLQLLDDYYRPIFTSEELILFEEDAKRIFGNESILNERINIHYSEWKILDDITDMRRWEKIWEDIVYDGNAEESENDFKYNNKSKTVQIPKYIYDRIKLYQKYQKLVDFLMGIAQKNNYYDYYGNLLRHDEDWFGDLGGTSLDILKDLYDLAGIKEIYDDPNQLRLFDSLHIDSDYIAEREEILRNAPRNAKGQLLAPNGKVSKLTEEQWVIVRTRAFKEWFGDWELFANIPEELLNQVSLVYERIPELAQIGTPVEYAAYLQSIFPNSKDKSIYWHGSDSDFSRGFDSAVKGKGSGSPHIAGEFYLAKQAWTVLQYVSGVNRIFGPDINGFNHWNKLWWELKEIMSNGRRHNNAWKDLIIGPENVRQGIPNKRGVFNRDSGGTNGKWLKERKADYGYQDRSDEEFFRDVFGIEYGKDTFNTWTQRNAEIFRSLEKTAKGIYPAIINATNPIRESGQNTYYEPERGLLTRAILNKNDAILGSNTDNEFNSDVAVIFNAVHNVHFLGTKQDIEAFKLWLQTNGASKVIDTETGEPKVVYHHTDNPNLMEFSTDFPNYFSQSNGGTKKAIFFDENTSGTLGRKYDLPVFLNIRNLTTYIGTKEDLHKKGTDYTAVVNESAARDARFGGLHMSKFDDNKLLNQDVWIIHDEHNVKSATSAHKFTSSPNIYDADPTPVYQTTPSKQSKLIEIVRQANEKGVKGIHIVSQSDLVNEDIYIRSANGFVRNGEIYINVDRAGDDTVIHEFGHLYLADAKVNNRERYYELLEKVRQTKLWSDMKTWKAYANKIGSDFDEEVLATMIGDYYKAGFENYEYESLVKEALELVDPAFIELLNSEILPDLGDTFITNYYFQQKVSTWKSKLVSDNILKENCL